jgi:hypothetical protein
VGIAIKLSALPGNPISALHAAVLCQTKIQIVV